MAQILSPGIRPTTVSLSAFVGESVTIPRVHRLYIAPTTVEASRPSGIVLPLVSFGSQRCETRVTLKTFAGLRNRSNSTSQEASFAMCVWCGAAAVVAFACSQSNVVRYACQQTLARETCGANDGVAVLVPAAVKA